MIVDPSSRVYVTASAGNKPVQQTRQIRMMRGMARIGRSE
jgi:hypothetical protein